MDATNGGGPAGASPRAAPFEVGGWRVEPAWHRISRGDETQKLEPRVMRLLEALAEAPGRPLTREQLLDTVWPNLNVNEDALSRAISQLRRALSDDPRRPAYIETVHKGGYCLIAPVRAPGGDALPGAGGGSSRRSPTRLAVAASVIAAAAVAALAVTIDSPAGTSPARAALVPIPLTSEFGREIDPAISRDGRRLAFTASTERGYDLFWRTIGGDRSFRLTQHDGQYAERPAWSPEGDRIAFLKGEAGRSAIHIVSLATGRAEKLIDLRSWSFGLDWSPDGRTIAYSDLSGGGTRSILLVDVATGLRRTITRSASSRGDRMPAFAPDGRRIAFVRDAGLGLDRIMVADLRGSGEPREILDRPEEIRGLDWDADGALIYSARAAGRYGLRKVASAGGRPQSIETEGGDLFNPSVSAKGDVVAEALERDSDIWGSDAGGKGGAPLIRSTRDDYDAVGAPASGRIAFVSERSGSPELWIAGRDGGEPRQATRLGSARLRGPVWSRDGRQIAFQAEASGYMATYVVSEGGTPVRIAGGGNVHHVPLGWGRTADELLIATGSGASWTVRRQDLVRGGSTALDAVAARFAAASPDGEVVYLISDDGAKLVRISTRTGASSHVPLPEPLRGADAMRASTEGLYVFVPKPGGTNIHRLKGGGGAAAVEQVALIPAFGHVSMTDGGRRILYTNERETSNDIVLLRL